VHEDSRCPGMGGQRDAVTVADALEVFDTSCSEEPDLTDEARALHCAIVAIRMERERNEGPKVGDGSGDAALAIGEHAFRAGYEACLNDACPGGPINYTGTVDEAWDAYDPPEDIKALS